MEAQTSLQPVRSFRDQQKGAEQSLYCNEGKYNAENIAGKQRHIERSR